MRLVVLVAATALLAGCSQTITGRPEEPTTGATSSSTTEPTPSTQVPSSTRANPADPPTAGAPVAAVIAWVETGRRVDASAFHTASRGEDTTDLGEDIAFTAGTTRCMTAAHYAENTLVCLVDLADPPPKPEAVYGEWKPGWIDYDGASLQVGSVHGDPGPFGKGDGAALPDGQTLAFGDYRCRTAPAGVFCVDYAHQSAVRLAPDGVDAFGCLQSVPAPEGVGVKYAC
ncbi:hypothetical protein H7J07_15065 [Mycobacterium koreense]|uniref:Uncharacterized protein n=1 Tax=Mycolicibacillus koreensis TaxID=1069220 RepID=A0A7I7SBR7_9MYCO|nr:hypothetical protein [Mycolicibacillus koreensis]MCV7249528.1 hypothetical protein [Mycolicibacillus koreensis]OSC30833.1 hypothetical protein B8W67_16705 [Mycolicibacillus koreensis]BBY53445.1 hypothetical protein MKOR_06960 [Mycolicibacillus koreensis]